MRNCWFFKTLAVDDFTKLLVTRPVFNLVNLATVVFETATTAVATHQITTFRIPRHMAARKSALSFHVHERSTQKRFLQRWEAGYFSGDKILSDRFDVLEVDRLVGDASE